MTLVDSIQAVGKGKPPSSARGAGRRITPIRRKQIITAYLFLIPAVVFFACMFFYPLFNELLTSFTSGLTNPVPVGMHNYVRALTDPVVIHSFFVTLEYAAGSLVGSIIVGLALAVVLNQKLRGRVVLRTMILVPYMTSIAIVGLLWRNILDPSVGILNTILKQVGLPGQEWLNTAPLQTLIGITVWQESGYVMMLFLAGLQAIPEEVYEAAKIDGAGVWARFRRITLPLLAPTTFFVLLVGVISSMQQFGLPYIVTNGGPGNATALFVFQVYQETFTNQDIGYASAMAFLLLIFILILSFIQMRIGRRKDLV
ncbi:sugar ABC transporter permease [Humibacter antri]